MYLHRSLRYAEAASSGSGPDADDELPYAAALASHRLPFLSVWSFPMPMP